MRLNDFGQYLTFLANNLQFLHWQLEDSAFMEFHEKLDEWKDDALEDRDRAVEMCKEYDEKPHNPGEAMDWELPLLDDDVYDVGEAAFAITPYINLAIEYAESVEDYYDDSGVSNFTGDFIERYKHLSGYLLKQHGGYGLEEATGGPGGPGGFSLGDGGVVVGEVSGDIGDQADLVGLLQKFL